MGWKMMTFRFEAMKTHHHDTLGRMLADAINMPVKLNGREGASV